MSDSDLDFILRLETIIKGRQDSPAQGSYTSELFAAGTQRIAQKVGEESIELALAACQGDSEEIKAECADLLFHLLVLLADRKISLADVVTELSERHTS